MEQLEVAIADFKGMKDGTLVDAKAILASQCREGLTLLVGEGYQGQIWLGSGNLIRPVDESKSVQYASRYVLENGQPTRYFRTGKIGFFGQLVKLEPSPITLADIPFEEYPLGFLEEVATKIAKGLSDITSSH